MAGFVEERLKADLRCLIKIYIEAFPFSFALFNQSPTDFDDELALYVDLIEEFKLEIISATSSGIQKYCNLFGISPINGIDEFKSIYFLGRAIEARLLAKKHVQIAQVHMYSMIGLLDEKLQSHEVFKEDLTRAMLRLIDVREFDTELGKSGCYFIYKCSSTAPDHLRSDES